jgi:hypothetical protein
MIQQGKSLITDALGVLGRRTTPARGCFPAWFSATISPRILNRADPPVMFALSLAALKYTHQLS